MTHEMNSNFTPFTNQIIKDYFLVTPTTEQFSLDRVEIEEKLFWEGE